MRTTSVSCIVLVLVGCGPSPFDLTPSESPSRLLIPRTTEESLPASIDLGATGVLEIDSLVATVLERNPTLESMEHARRAAATRRAQATALDDPMLSYSAAPESFGDSAIDDGHEVELSQRFPWPGKLRLRGERADRAAYAAAHDADAARRDLERDARRAFYAYYFVHRAIEINTTNLDLLGEFERIAESKYAAGTVPRQDVLQARVERLHLEHEAVILERQRRVAAATINTLIHRPPDADLPPPPAQVGRPSTLPDLAALRDEAVNARPELQSLAQRLEVARADRRLAAKEYFPDVTVMSTYSTMWAEPEHRWMLGAGINLPIQVGRRRAAEAEALSESQRIAAQLVAGVDRVTFEVTEAYEQLVESEHVIHLYSGDLITTARENLASARTGYEAGETDFLTFLTAERDLHRIELSYERALAEYHQRFADLERAVGRTLNKENPR